MWNPGACGSENTLCLVHCNERNGGEEWKSGKLLKERYKEVLFWYHIINTKLIVQEIYILAKTGIFKQNK